MRRINKSIFASFLMAVLCPTAGLTQTQITHQVLSNGGTAMANENHRLQGTVGQLAVGSSANSSHTLHAGYWPQVDVVVTSVEEIEQNTLPETFRLDQNYPNPFNPTTTIQFALPGQSSVSLKLFDLLGREVATLIDEEMAAGEYKLQFEAAHLPSGVYFYIIKADGFVASRKLTLLK